MNDLILFSTITFSKECDGNELATRSELLILLCSAASNLSIELVLALRTGLHHIQVAFWGVLVDFFENDFFQESPELFLDIVFGGAESLKMTLCSLLCQTNRKCLFSFNQFCLFSFNNLFTRNFAL